MDILQTISRNIAYPAWNAREGGIRLSELSRLQTAQWDSREALEDYQLTRLNSVVRWAADSVPFYKNRWSSELTKSPLKSLSALSDFPVIYKDDLRKYKNELLSSRFAKSELVTAKTGGSTGVSLELFFDRQCQQLRNAAAMMSDGWAGWLPGMKVAALWGSPPTPKTAKQKIRNFLHDRTFYLDTMRLNEETLGGFSRSLIKRKPNILFGHAHSLYELACFIQANDLPVPRLVGIVSTSMVLLDADRLVIEKVFGVRVTNRYGCEEVGLIASECEQHDGLHINSNHIIVEFLDDNDEPVEAGEEGRVVLTDLNNRAMPLVRYDVGDMAVPSNKQCSCGRGLPIIKNLAGRVSDYFIHSDGSKVSGISMVEKTLTAIEGLGQLQIVQNTTDTFVLNAVVADGCESRVKEELHRAMVDAFSSEVSIELRCVRHLDQTRAGKFRFAICNVE